MRKKNEPTLGSVGEWGFLRSFLPQLSRFQKSRFLVSPGDDAAVLKTPARAVLSIDGLTEATHFLSSWNKRCRSIGGFPLGRGLGWKLLGSGLSDLAAMGNTQKRWAMIYLGARPSTPISFLRDFYNGLHDTAKEFNCALAGGDTVKAKDVSMVAAVGGELQGRPLIRKGAKPGDLIAIAGTVGDASIGLRILQNTFQFKSNQTSRFFIRRFFQHRPLFKAGKILAGEKGVTCAMDLSDAVKDTVEIICRDSNVSAHVQVESIPVSSEYRRNISIDQALLTGGEDYALMFTVRPSRVAALAKKLKFSVIGSVSRKGSGATFSLNGKKLKSLRSFQHFN